MLHRNTRLYLADFWNVVDAVSVVVDTLTVALARDFWHPRDEQGARTFLCEVYTASGAVALVLVWTRLLYYVTVHKQCGTLVRMTLFMAFDIIPFLIILFFVLVGFGFAFFFMFLGENDASGHEDVANIHGAIYLAFKTLVHEPAFDIFESIGENDGSSPRQTLAIGLYFLYILCSNILLLNLLIAIMTSSYERVNANIHREFLFQKAEVIVYYNHLALPSPVNVFHVAYLAAARLADGATRARKLATEFSSRRARGASSFLASTRSPRRQSFLGRERAPTFVPEHLPEEVDADASLADLVKRGGLFGRSDSADPERDAALERSMFLRKAAAAAEYGENATENRRLLLRTVFAPEIAHILSCEAAGTRPRPKNYTPTSAEIIEAILVAPDLGAILPPRDDE